MNQEMTKSKENYAQDSLEVLEPSIVQDDNGALIRGILDTADHFTTLGIENAKAEAKEVASDSKFWEYSIEKTTVSRTAIEKGKLTPEQVFAVCEMEHDDFQRACESRNKRHSIIPSWVWPAILSIGTGCFAFGFTVGRNTK